MPTVPMQQRLPKVANNLSIVEFTAQRVASSRNAQVRHCQRQERTPSLTKDSFDKNWILNVRVFYLHYIVI